MNQNAKRFVSALRSGTYLQATGSLRKMLPHKGWGYCCLGVACMVYGDATGDWPSLNGIDLPPEVRQWLNFDASGGGYEGGSLIQCNDELHMTFEQIADVIESEPKGLFSTASTDSTTKTVDK